MSGCDSDDVSYDEVSDEMKKWYEHLYNDNRSICVHINGCNLCKPPGNL